MEPEVSTSDIQSKVLQNTLAEVASRNPSAAEGDKNETCCVICLDSITEVCEARPCQHRHFDYLCLLSWLEQQKNCPLCKSDITEVLFDFDHEGPGSKKAYFVPRPKDKVEAHAPPNSRERYPNRRPIRPPRDQGPHRPASEDEALLRRQRVYREQLYALHVGSNPRSRYRDITPATFEAEPELVSRARAWLRRELQVFEFLRPPSASTPQASDDAMTRRRANNAEFLLEYIVAILKTVDTHGSQGQAEDMLKDFLGRQNARLLLHELRNFLRSPWSIQAWDREVQYPTARKRRYEDAGDVRAESENADGGVVDSRKTQRGDSYRPTYTDRRRRQLDTLRCQSKPR
ncbi:hypothetical protein F4780DRAFT_687095 [Xylariomycetidae sp. FL0641]|nr:hypothetical protein F4780DRAFT_687095 [Xylariomycetidae sp. FL0641]